MQCTAGSVGMARVQTPCARRAASPQTTGYKRVLDGRYPLHGLKYPKPSQVKRLRVSPRCTRLQAGTSGYTTVVCGYTTVWHTVLTTEEDAIGGGNGAWHVP